VTIDTARSPEYTAALNAIIAAENAFHEAGLAELHRLMPDDVSALIFTINDTPRLSFDAYRDLNGEEFEAEDIGPYDLYDHIDEVAMEMGFREWDDADNWLMRDTTDEERFMLERAVAA